MARIIGGWTVTNPPRTVGSSTCGGLSAVGQLLIGGQGLLGHASALERDFALPHAHTEVRVVLEFVKIDLWDGSTARMMLDGEEGVLSLLALLVQKYEY